jgi:hypothetical protein
MNSKSSDWMEMMALLRRHLLLQLGSMGTQALPHPYLIA